MSEHEFTYDVAPGQRRLLDAPPCDCDAREVEGFMDAVVGHALLSMDERGLCATAVATGLVLCAASLFNPANFREPAPPAMVQRTLDMARIFETIAKGMRERVGY